MFILTVVSPTSKPLWRTGFWGCSVGHGGRGPAGSPPPPWHIVGDGPGPLPPSSLTEQRLGWPRAQHTCPVSALCQEEEGLLRVSAASGAQERAGWSQKPISSTVPKDLGHLWGSSAPDPAQPTCLEVSQGSGTQLWGGGELGAQGGGDPREHKIWGLGLGCTLPMRVELPLTRRRSLFWFTQRGLWLLGKKLTLDPTDSGLPADLGEWANWNGRNKFLLSPSNLLWNARPLHSTYDLEGVLPVRILCN